MRLRDAQRKGRTMRIAIIAAVLEMLAVANASVAGEAPADANDHSRGVEIAEVTLTGRLEEGQLTLKIDFEAVTREGDRRVTLLRGEAVLDQVDPATTSSHLNYLAENQEYTLSWSRRGRHRFSAEFKVRSASPAGDPWRQAQLDIPIGRMRHVHLLCRRPDLEVELPGALRVDRKIEGGQLVIRALLGPRQPLVIRWKPQVQLANAKLVLSSQANTIVDVRAGFLELDSVFDFEVAQGKIETLLFNLPPQLHVTSIEGSYIRHWEVGRAAEGRPQLRVELNRPQESAYRLHIRAEATVSQLPAEIEVPVITPEAGMRAGGHLVVGTNDALQVVVRQSTGLTQIDAAAFPRVQSSLSVDRAVPQGKAFYYAYAGRQYQLLLSVDDVVPTYDVVGRLVIQVKEDDLLLEAELELDIRDAPLRQFDVALPAGLVVASVEGEQVDDYHVVGPSIQDQATLLRILFTQPVLGRSLVKLALELGRGPLDQTQTIEALQVVGAKTLRGYVVVATEAGIELDPPQVINLREVHAASLPLRAAQARYAYRYRQPDWQISLLARHKPAGIRSEVFHLQSIGESLAYGSAVIHYLITGSPVDELQFRLPASLENVEFVGRDVRRFQAEQDLWTVQLTRKVIGGYSLALTYSQRYGPDLPIQLGSLRCEGIQTQTGFVVVTSRLDLKLDLGADPGTGGPGTNAPGLLPIAMDELPADYRLLTSSPILATYRYVTDPHVASLSITPHRRSALLPVVVDMAAHQTTLAVRPDGRIESVTTVRYKVKNSSGQFLSLAMPPGAQVWAVREIDEGNADAEPTRLATSREGSSGRLLIPLRRHSNPNDPTTIELEYGQVHPTHGRWRRHLELSAPACTIPMAYADWQVTVPDAWAIQEVGSRPRPSQPGSQARSLAGILQQTGNLWSQAFSGWLHRPGLWIASGILLLVVLLCAFLRPAWLPDLTLLALLGLLLSLGIAAARCGEFEQPASRTQLTVARAVTTQEDQSLTVQAQLMPAWRQDLGLMECVALALIGVAALALGVFKARLRWVAAAALAADLIYLAAKLAVTWPLLHALMTWGIPAALALWFLIRALLRIRLRWPVPVPVTTLLLMVPVALTALLSGCAAAGGQGTPITDVTPLRRIDCSVTAGSDTLELAYELQVETDGPTRFPLLEDSALLLSAPKRDASVTVETTQGRHWVHIDRAGSYSFALRFLMPLPAADEAQRRGLSLPLPVALTNRISLSIPDANMLIEAPRAVSLRREEEADRVAVHAMFQPGEPARFHWRPRERQAAQEVTRFYAQDHALAYVTSGLLRVYHALRLQIAQGQLDTLRLDLNAGETVTSVQAESLGDWRFDPTTQQLEVKLTRPVTGTYELLLVTEVAYDATPYTVTLTPLRLREALYQHNVLGLAADASVYVQVDQHPATLNTQDYLRDNRRLLDAVPGLTRAQVTKAFRFDSPDQRVTGRVFPVESEVRSEEVARFNVEDDRLVYNSQWTIDIAKAGRFDLDLLLPQGFDIDSVAAAQMSHWDETVQANQRRLRIHFKRKLIGSFALKLALSQPLAQMPEQIAAPRVQLVGALKHTGRLIVGSEQGVRLSVVARQGVSELNPADLGHRAQGLLAFKLLRPLWQLTLQIEVLEPRITVRSLHVARVADGLVRHQHTLRYRLLHAGSKTFHLALPSDATGTTISGAGITRREEIEPGRWRIELADKVYDRPYLLRLTYETRYDPDEGRVVLPPIRCEDADLQQGHTVVYATDRVELATETAGTTMLPGDARRIPTFFGAGDLSGAAMCYRSASPDQVLTITAVRHDVAAQMGAQVQRTDITTVVTESGQTINRVLLTLKVGDQRYLQTTLPDGATLWSAAVDGQAAHPSLRDLPGGGETLLLPLPQQASEDVVVDLVYIANISRSGPTPWSGRQLLSGPRFNLPLREIVWQLYLPEGFSYQDPGGTLSLDRTLSKVSGVRRYTLESYEVNRLNLERRNEIQAETQQRLAQKLSQQGRQEAARRALSRGYNYSLGNFALNEDIRVDLDNLLREQVKAGLINSRDRLRRQAAGTEVSQRSGPMSQGIDSAQMGRKRAQQIEGTLSQRESENLELITRRIIQTQDAAIAPSEQLQITMPIRGKLLRFTSPMQVEPNADMHVEFNVTSPTLSQMDPSIGYGLGLFLLLLAARGLFVRACPFWDRQQLALDEASMAQDPDVQPVEDEPSEPEGPVSADEL